MERELIRVEWEWNVGWGWEENQTYLFLPSSFIEAKV